MSKFKMPMPGMKKNMKAMVDEEVKGSTKKGSRLKQGFDKMAKGGKGKC